MLGIASSSFLDSRPDGSPTSSALRRLGALTVRIVGGRLSGRRFSGPPTGLCTRPTSERVREGIASALVSGGWIEGTRVLDLYAGTGALAFEALSRGAREATLVEKSRPVARAIERSARELGIEDVAMVIVADLERLSSVRALEGPFDLVLVDPPYARIAHVEVLLSALASEAKLRAGAGVVVEHARRGPPKLPVGFDEISSYRYGDTAVLLARAATDEDI